MDLIVSNATVRLGGRMVLDSVDLALRAGRVTVVMGANGAGKSTLVKAMAALVPLATGDIRLGPDAVIGLEPRARARAIGYLPQDATVHWNMRARDVVALGRLPHRNPHAAPSAVDEAAVDRALAATDSVALADRSVATLSGGERARTLLARVLAGEPRWLLADEPLASLDPAHQIDLVARLRAYAATGAGVVIVVHDLLQAQRAADDAVLLHDGRVAAAGEARAVLTPDNLARVFGIRVAAIDDGNRRFWVPIGRAEA